MGNIVYMGSRSIYLGIWIYPNWTMTNLYIVEGIVTK